MPKQNEENEEQRSELITRKQAAQYLHLSAGTVGNWASTGKHKLPSIRMGSRVFYRIADLDRFIELNAINKIN